MSLDKNIITISDDPINATQYNEWLSDSKEDGAIVTFIGKVRSLDDDIKSLYLEHYLGMTEQVLENIIKETRKRWEINRIILVHRIGKVLTNEHIVYVGVSSAHRKNAFSAAEFIMDMLKNEAPFWKKEQTSKESRWVEAKKSDKNALKKWH